MAPPPARPRFRSSPFFRFPFAPALALLLAAAAAGSAPPLAAQSAPAYPPGEPLVATPTFDAFRLNGANGRASLVDVAGPGFSRAWRIDTVADTSPTFAIEWRTAVTRPLARGDVGLIRFVARAVFTSDESGAAYARLYVQKASPEYDKSVQGTHSLGSDWNEYFVPFVADADYPARAAEVVFGFGFKRQIVEIGGIEAVYYGRSVPFASLPRSRPSYAGREPDAPWRTAALARIETLRRGDITVLVTDAAGRPVPGASVRVTQTKSAFHFGSALQFSRLVSDTPANRVYRQKVLELFNAASPENDLKWPAWSGEWGSNYSRAQALAALAWLKQHGFHTRGHVLVWPSWRNLPPSVSSLRGTARQSGIPALVREHIADVAGATRDLLDEWDVLNEPYANHDLMDLFGAPIQAEWFHAARAAHPTAALYLNDYSNHDAVLDAPHVAHFEATARFLLAQGAPLGGLGLQAHIGPSPSAPANVLATLDRYAALGLPVRITEFDVNTDDEELQADYTRDFLIALYSHPSVVGCQLWGFWAGAHWIPQAAMYRTDWSEKPGARAWKSLVLDRWRTRAGGPADAAGTFRTRGYHGDYTVAVVHDGRTYERTFQLRPGTADTIVRVPLAAPRLSNLSTRAAAGTGDAALIPGFVVAGTAPKRLLLRGVGPGLAGFGVAGALPRLELALIAENGTRLAANRGWDTGPPDATAALAAAASRAGAFALAPGSADAALLVSLAPGAYTAPVTPLDGASGIALVEAYDLDEPAPPAVPAAAPSRLANLSTRARVGPGQQVAIPGVVVDGPNARTLLVRAIGPGLAAFGLAGTLARPTLVVQQESRPLAANAGWEVAADPAALAAATARAGAFALRPGQPDAALLVTLAAGAYTIQVAGADGGAGLVLVEVYDLGT